MKIKQKDILGQVPHSITDLKVICQDHRVQIGIMHAHWSDVKEYFEDKIKGGQFGRRIERGTLP